MKIAFITNAFPILYNTFTVNEIEQLKQRGHDVSIFALYRQNRSVAYQKSVELVSETHFLEDVLVGNRGRIVNLLVYHAAKLRRVSPWAHDLLGRYMFDHDTAPEIVGAYRQELGWVVYALAKTAEIIRSGGFDVIHAGFGNRPAEVAMILSRLSGIPYSFEAHAYDLFVDFPFAKEKISEALKIFTISNYNKAYLTDTLGCPAEKVSVMRVPFDKSHCDSIPMRPRERDLLVAVCRLHPIKGLTVALDAIKIVAKKRRGVRFVMVGDGPAKKELAQKVRQLSLHDNVVFAGSMGNEEALAVVAKATAFVLPSVVAPNGDRDGIPTSLIEAMYLRTPVISSRVSGIPELVDHGINGLLTEPGDAQGLAKAIEQILDSADLREQLGQAARQKIEHGFYVQEAADVLLNGWTDALGSWNARSGRDRQRA